MVAGLTWPDLKQGTEDELEENKEQLANHKLRDEMGKVDPADRVQAVDLIFRAAGSDIWNEPKRRPYLAVVRERA